MMNSDDYFVDELDSGILKQLDTIEAAHHQRASREQASSAKVGLPRHSRDLESEDSFVDLTLDLNEADLQRLDSFISDAYKGKTKSVARPSQPSSSLPRATVQTTLFNDIVHTSSMSSTPNSQRSRNKFGQQAPKTKQWDHTAFAKSGWKRSRSGKGREKAEYEDDEHMEDVEFEQFPAPFPPPMKLDIDLLEAKHWIYPLNHPKRDYQFNIVMHSLFENTLVALPTGLGKTFIAGVVMLNYYRWFPEGKVIFVAPTKPLVAQQVEACHRICGIPGSDAVELTGEKSRALRSRMWAEKRVFYMTPQTLMNDLRTENCDPGNIILIVVDEAHKGTGDYAYAQVMRYMMAKNPHFRVLALTATPGSSPEAVQTIIDSLHISRIEIRDERSLDLRKYMHKKEIKQHIIRMNDEIVHFQQLLKAVMEDILKPLVAKGVLEPLDVVRMHPYRAMATMQRIASRRSHPQKWALGGLSKLGAMARAMGYLMEASAGMCFNCLQEFVAEKENNKDGKKGPKKNLKDSATFQRLLSELETRKAQPRGFGMHPKMETLKLLLIQHFGVRMGGGDGEETDKNSRAMVFVTFRECVDEIVEILNEERPLLKATKFIGQGFDKQGRKGFAQKEQLEVIRKFKAGEFNVLVSTSIGEEGLDIGEVDMIVCYDAQKTPIRMLQRVGRTGRKRDGYVHVLLSEIREELNWDKAQDTYGELQKCIVRGDQLELYNDVPRLLPDHVRPQVLEKNMEIQEYIREELSERKKASFADEDGGATTKGRKRKRNDAIDRNIPLCATKGFVSVADLLVKQKKKKKKVKTRRFDDNLADDDSTDMELETNLMDTGCRVSTPAIVDKSSKSKDSVRRTSTMNDGVRGMNLNRKKKEKRSKSPVVDELDHQSKDTPTDTAFELDDAVPDQSTTPPSYLKSDSHSKSKPVIPGGPPNSTIPSTRRTPLGIQSRQLTELSTSPLSPHLKSPVLDHPSKQKEDDDELPVYQRDPSPSQHSVVVGDDQDLSWLLDEEDEPIIRIVSSPPAVQAVRRNSQRDHRIDGAAVASSPKSECSDVQMPPPDGYSLDMQQSPSWFSDVDMPEASFVVRPVGKRVQKRHPSAVLDTPPPPTYPARCRLMRRDTEIPPRPATPPRPRKRKPIISIRHNPWLDGEAGHSGGEVSEGSSHSEEDVESESDRQFLKDMPTTQVSPSYDQLRIYRQSLLSQHPGMQDGPMFANKPLRRGALRAQEDSRRRLMVSSSPRESDVPDEYALGSFVVPDDADLSFE